MEYSRDIIIKALTLGIKKGRIPYNKIKIHQTNGTIFPRELPEEYNSVQAGEDLAGRVTLSIPKKVLPEELKAYFGDPITSKDEIKEIMDAIYSRERYEALLKELEQDPSLVDQELRLEGITGTVSSLVDILSKMGSKSGPKRTIREIVASLPKIYSSDGSFVIDTPEQKEDIVSILLGVYKKPIDRII